MFEDNVGESSQSSHRRVEDENVGESFKTSDDSATYKKLLEECDKELYPGCKYSNVSFMLHLYHVKCIDGVSDKTFGMFLELIRDVFPHLTSLPSSVSEAKKLTKDLGLAYKKIDACTNDCMIYWDTRKDQSSCHVCKVSRFKSDTADDIVKLTSEGSPPQARHHHGAAVVVTAGGGEGGGGDVAVVVVAAGGDDEGGVRVEPRWIYSGGVAAAEGGSWPENSAGDQMRGRTRCNMSNKRTRDGVGCLINAHDEANAESSAFEDMENFVEEETSEHLYANKLFEVGISERDDPEKRLEIAREVMQQLRPPKKNGRTCGYEVGVTKSQVTKFIFDLRRMRRQGVSSENRFMLNKVVEQSKQIENQSRKMNTMEENMTRFIGELKTMLSDFFATRTSKTHVCDATL
nr:tetratricopeptide-like helical domain, DYW domain protein [Tanacetum cinerariifolium]